jgi:CheY-like chemotaxis protein
MAMMHHSETSHAIDSQRQHLRARSQRRILIVDDEPMICRFVAQALRSELVEALCCPQAALARADEVRFDMVFCDFRMPRMTGIQLYDELLRRYAQRAPAFTLMTGGLVTADVLAFLDAQPVQLLCKPFGVLELTRCLERSTRHVEEQPQAWAAQSA